MTSSKDNLPPHASCGGEPLNQPSINRPSNRILKRTADLVIGGMLTLLILSWLIPIVGLLIKLDSKGPVFFIQRRTGRNRKTFLCIKFRTMFMNPESDRLPVQPDDERITRSGRLLRHFYIDELPQLLNILEGSMSLIGPRPHMLRETIIFTDLVTNYDCRHLVKPGLTGLAQVRGYHGMIITREDLELRIASDLEYISGWNTFTDPWILAHTLIRIFGRNH
jgi:putative colanic acid biosynthesis UDP-glucose lipid carrier transferase